MHCFNHRLELSIKDAFERVDTFINQLYLLYGKSPKRLHELKAFGDEYERTIPKPTKAYGTRWIDHKVRAM